MPKLIYILLDRVNWNWFRHFTYVVDMYSYTHVLTFEHNYVLVIHDIRRRVECWIWRTDVELIESMIFFLNSSSFSALCNETFHSPPFPFDHTFERVFSLRKKTRITNRYADIRVGNIRYLLYGFGRDTSKLLPYEYFILTVGLPTATYVRVHTRVRVY